MLKKVISFLLVCAVIIGQISIGIKGEEVAKDVSHLLENLQFRVEQNGQGLNWADHRILQDSNFTLKAEFQVPVSGDRKPFHVSKGDFAKIILFTDFPKEIKIPDEKIALLGRASDGVTYRLGELSIAMDWERRELYADLIFSGDDSVFNGTLHGVIAAFDAEFLLPLNQYQKNIRIGQTDNFQVDLPYLYKIQTEYSVDGTALIPGNENVLTQNKGIMEVTIKAEKRKNLNEKEQSIEADLAGVFLDASFLGWPNGKIMEGSFYLNGKEFREFVPKLHREDRLPIRFPLLSTGQQTIQYRIRLNEAFLYRKAAGQDIKRHEIILRDSLKADSILEKTHFDVFRYQFIAFSKLEAKWENQEEDLLLWTYDVNLSEGSFEEVYFNLNNLFGKHEEILSIKEQKKEAGNWIDTGKEWKKQGETRLEGNFTIGTLSGARRYLILTKLKNSALKESTLANSISLYWKDIMGSVDTSGSFTVIKSKFEKIVGEKQADSYMTEWVIRIPKESLQSLSNPKLYDLMIFDRDMEARMKKKEFDFTKISGLPSGFQKEKLQKLVWSNLEQSVTQKYLNGTLKAEGLTVETKTLQYEGKDFADLLVIGGAKNKDWNIQYQSYLTDYYAVFMGDDVIRNFAVLMDNDKIAAAQLGEAKIKRDSFLELFFMPNDIIDRFNANPIAESIIMPREDSGLDIEKNGFNYKDYSITYALRINPHRYGKKEGSQNFGTKNVMDKITYGQKLPEGFEFAELPGNKKMMIFRMQKDGENYVATGTELASIPGMNLLEADFLGKRELKIEFNEDLQDSYFIILRAKAKPQWWTDTKKVRELETISTSFSGKIKNGSGFVSHQNTQEDLRVLSKTVEEVDGKLRWQIEFKPWQYEMEDSEIWLTDQLPAGIKMGVNPDGSLKGAPYFLLQEASIKADGSLSPVKEILLEKGKNIRLEGRQLKVLLPKDGKPYRFSYMTEILSDAPEKIVNQAELALAKPVIPAVKAEFDLLTLRGHAKYQLGAWLEVLKLDKQSLKPLAGVEFDLLYQGGAVQKLKTDKDGLIFVKDMPEGKHILREAKALSGYQIITEDCPIEVFKDGTGKMSVKTNGKRNHQLVVLNSKDAGDTGDAFKTKEEIKPTPEKPTTPIVTDSGKDKPIQHDVDEESIPQDKPKDLPKEEKPNHEELGENNVPKGNHLPKTGGIPFAVLAGMGIAFIWGGKKLRR